MWLTFCFHAKEVSEVYLFHSYKKNNFMYLKEEKEKDGSTESFLHYKVFFHQAIIYKNFC